MNPKMGARVSSGFTIIETMLFLGITGLLIVGVLVGTGVSLNNQRYKDAVETFKGDLQQQFADLGSVYNSRSNTWSCDAAAQPVEEGQVIRGQSDCLIVGRYMRIQESDIQLYTVLARENVGSPPRSSDIETLSRNYVYNVASAEAEQKQLEWGTALAWPRQGAGSEQSGPRSIGILFIRSPETGNIYTFTDNAVPEDVASINSETFTRMMIADAVIPGRGQRTLCVQSGGLFVGGDMAISINQFAASASAIEMRSNDWMRENMGSNAPQC